MKKVLLDTSVLIDFLRRKDKEKSFLAEILRLDYSPVISIVTHTELFAGKRVWQKKRARDELEELLSGLKIVILNQEVSRLAGRMRAKYQIKLLEAIIAAEAIISHLPLATLNLKDFKKVKEVKIFGQTQKR